MKWTFSFPNRGFVKNVIIFGVGMSPSVHADDRKKDILILAEVPKQRLDNTKLTAEKKHSDNIAVTRKEFCLGFHYKGESSYLFIMILLFYFIW